MGCHGKPSLCRSFCLIAFTMACLFGGVAIILAYDALAAGMR